MESVGEKALRRLRADVVGSMLRPAALKDAIWQHREGAIGNDQLRQAENRAITDLVRTEEQIGLPVAVDGEFRRTVYTVGFADVTGFEGWVSGWTGTMSRLRDAEGGVAERPRKGTDPLPHVQVPATERLRLAHNRVLDEYRFAQALTDRPVKVTMIGPDRVVQSFDRAGSRAVFPDVDAFLADVIAVQRQMIAELIEAGCRYVQIDEPGFTSYVDAPSITQMRAAGLDPNEELDRSIAATNAVVEGFEGVTFGVHICRGNRMSQWHRDGTYDLIAERLFGQLKHDRLLLEYDTERAGDFAPLRFVQPAHIAVLGLVTTKRPELEDADALVRRIDEATHYLPIEQLALSPQCGFASVLEGNRLTEEDQWRKLELVLRVADRVWG